MRIRTTAAAVAVLGLALTACSGNDKPDAPAPASTSASATADPWAAEAECKAAWSKAVEDGSIDDGSVSAEKPPAECAGVASSARLGIEAIKEHIEEGRERHDACTEDPSSCLESAAP
jgi:hypothetical protein